MSEEKKILEIQDTAKVPAPPKKRGRKKNTDAKDVDTVNTENAIENIDASDKDGSPEKEAESTSDKETENADKPVTDAKDTTDADNADTEQGDAEVTDNGTEAVTDSDTADSEQGDAELTNNGTEAVTDGDTADAEQGDTEIADNGTEAVTDSDTADSEQGDTEVTDSGTEAVTDGDNADLEDESPEAHSNNTDGTYANIEHFSDTYEIKYLSDEVESANENVKDEEPAVDMEYENLKIFEDTEPEVKREPKQKRVREVSPDYKEYNEEKPRHVDARFDFIELFVYTLVVIMLITTFFFKHSEVSGWSMKGTLSDRDHVLISDFLYEPKQYDIVVVHDPAALEEAVVKRIIALGGQTVRLEYKLVKEKSDMSPYYALDVFVDGEKVPDEYCYCDGPDYSLYVLNTVHKLKGVKLDAENPERYEHVTFEYIVPEGEIYVMGDHRNDSTDSRRFGSVNENKILGRLIIRFFPFDSFGTVD